MIVELWKEVSFINRSAADAIYSDGPPSLFAQGYGSIWKGSCFNGSADAVYQENSIWAGRFVKGPADVVFCFRPPEEWSQPDIEPTADAAIWKGHITQGPAQAILIGNRLWKGPFRKGNAVLYLKEDRYEDRYSKPMSKAMAAAAAGFLLLLCDSDNQSETSSQERSAWNPCYVAS